MRRHVGAEALARYREGDLGSRKSARIRAHLASCPRCAALDEDLAGVSVLLASAPQPAMPEQVTARIQAALMAEAAQAAQLGTGHQAGQAPEAGQPREHGQPRHSRQAGGPAGAGRSWRLRGLQSPLALRTLATAAVAIVIAGGVYGTIQLAGGPAGTSSSAGTAAEPEFGRIATIGPPLQFNSGSRTSDVTPVSTGTNFQSRQLTSQVRSVLLRSAGKLPVRQHPESSTRHTAQPGHGSAGTVISPNAARQLSGVQVAALPGCVQRISAGGRVQLVDVDRYQGKPATIIVVAAGRGSLIWVVGPGCSRSDSDVVAHASLPAAG
jgi:hypothetical protein